VLIAPDVARRHVSVALSLEKNLLTVAMADPLLFGVIEDLESSTGRRIRPVVSTRSDILAAIESTHSDTPDTQVERHGSKELSTADDRETPSSVELVDQLLKRAVATSATDIHIEPTDTAVVIRPRLDGVLKAILELPRSTHDALIAQIKSRAGLDVVEKRLPQQGRLRPTNDDGGVVHFRVTTLPTMFGEKAVLRLVDRRKAAPTLESIGLSKTMLETTHQLLRLRRGLILVVGPTGSGRTRTLVSMLSAIRRGAASIVTIEDPIEYQIEDASQTEISEPVGLTFANALRSVMQQDPDVVLVGELRDRETAALAVEAVASGKLVLSALSGDDAPSAVVRLAEMGIERSAMVSALAGVVAQRLVRQLCPQCRRPATPPLDQLRLLGVAESDAAAMVCYEPTGCDQCNHTGYRGRTGIYEVMRVSDALRRIIAAGSPEQIREQAIADGMVTLGEDGLAKLKGGLTAAAELLRQVPDRRERRTLCAACGSAVRPDFKACPACGTRLGVCLYCGRALEPGWTVCPYCTRQVPAR
jgi:type IV pilus assembly protein PilB